MKRRGLPAKRYSIPVDGLKGPKTSQAAADIRKQAKRGETLLGAMSRIAGTDLSDADSYSNFMELNIDLSPPKFQKLDL